MSVHYVGGEPTRITCYTARKNTTRFMHEPKQKIHLPSSELVLCAVISIAVITFLVWFVAMCLK